MEGVKQFCAKCGERQFPGEAKEEAEEESHYCHSLTFTFSE